ARLTTGSVHLSELPGGAGVPLSPPPAPPSLTLTVSRDEYATATISRSWTVGHPALCRCAHGDRDRRRSACAVICHWRALAASGARAAPIDANAAGHGHPQRARARQPLCGAALPLQVRDTSRGRAVPGGASRARRVVPRPGGAATHGGP